MRVLTVPNWSFGRDKDLLRQFSDILEAAPVRVHFLESDVDHNRTVSAFSGEAEIVFDLLDKLADKAFERIDLNRHVGVHPRIGALDVCPFVTMPEWEVPFEDLDEQVQLFGDFLADKYSIPVFLYEKSEKGRHESDLPSLRRAGFGGLIGKELNPDYGPKIPHAALGVTIMGIRDFLIATNVNLETENLNIAREIARLIRDARREGDERFLGVRALGFPLISRHLTQVSINLTLPDLAPADPVIEYVMEQAMNAGINVAGTELIGVIRWHDLLGSSRIPYRPEQVVDRVVHEV